MHICKPLANIIEEGEREDEDALAHCLTRSSLCSQAMGSPNPLKYVILVAPPSAELIRRLESLLKGIVPGCVNQARGRTISRDLGKFYI